METKKCVRCLSENPPDAAYCRFCHERFGRLKTFIEKALPALSRPRFSRRMIVAVGAMLAITISFIFRRKSSGQKDKPIIILE